jgi:hypothetical protein
MPMSYAPPREWWLELVEVHAYEPGAVWGDRRVFVYGNPRASAARAP